MERFGHEWKQKTRKLFQVAGYMNVLGLGRYVEWCRRRDSNSHDRGPLPPQDSVSTSSTTSALFLTY
jgi:hypothetical protein